jgi:hypothetical protein
MAGPIPRFVDGDFPGNDRAPRVADAGAWHNPDVAVNAASGEQRCRRNGHQGECMHRLIAIVALLATAMCSPVRAAVVYNWQASCVERIFHAGGDATDLGCSGDVHGQFVLPEGYVPGTDISSPGGGRFIIFDDVFLAYTGQPFASYGLGASTLTLPLDAGAPSGILTSSAFIADFTAAGLRFSTELALSSPITGFVLTASNVTAQRVPEPATWLLVLLAAALLLVAAGQRTVRAASQESAASA